MSMKQISEIAARLGVQPVEALKGTVTIVGADGRHYDVMQVTDALIDRMDALTKRALSLDEFRTQLSERIDEFSEALRRGRCEPPPEHRGRRWHWMRDPEGILSCGWWLDGFCGHDWQVVSGTFTGEALARLGWRYIAPCEEPKIEPGG